MNKIKNTGIALLIMFLTILLLRQNHTVQNTNKFFPNHLLCAELITSNNVSEEDISYLQQCISNTGLLLSSISKLEGDDARRFNIAFALQMGCYEQAVKTFLNIEILTSPQAEVLRNIVDSIGQRQIQDEDLWEQIIDAVAHIEHKAYEVDIYMHIIEIRVQLGLQVDALWQKAMETADIVKEGCNKVTVFRQIAELRMELNLPSDYAWKKAIDSVKDIRYDEDKYTGLIEIAKLGIKLGLPAGHIWDQLIELGKRIKVSGWRNNVFEEILQAMLEVGLFQLALETTQDVKEFNEDEKSQALIGMSEWLEENGIEDENKWQQIISIAQIFEDKKLKVSTLSVIAKSRTKLNLPSDNIWQQVMTLVQEIPSDKNKSILLAKLAQLRQEAGLSSDHIWDESVAIACNIEDENNRNNRLRFIVEMMVRSGLGKKAVDLSHAFEEKYKTNTLLYTIVDILAKTGQWQQAIDVLEEIVNFENLRDKQEWEWIPVAPIVDELKAKNIQNINIWQQLITIAGLCKDMSRETRIKGLAQSMKETGIRDIILWDQIMQIAQDMRNVEERDRTLRLIAEALFYNNILFDSDLKSIVDKFQDKDKKLILRNIIDDSTLLNIKYNLKLFGYIFDDFVLTKEFAEDRSYDLSDKLYLIEGTILGKKVNVEAFQALLVLFKKQKQMGNISGAEEILNVFSLWVKEKDDYLYSLDFLNSSLAQILKTEHALSDIDKCVIDALLKTGQGSQLIGFIVDDKFEINYRWHVMMELSRQGIIDEEIALIFTQYGSMPLYKKQEILIIIEKLYKELNVCPFYDVIVKISNNIDDSGMSLEETTPVEYRQSVDSEINQIRQSMSYLEKLSLDKLLEEFFKEKGEYYRLIYYVFKQPKSIYNFPFNFRQFNDVIDQTRKDNIKIDEKGIQLAEQYLGKEFMDYVREGKIPVEEEHLKNGRLIRDIKVTVGGEDDSSTKQIQTNFKNTMDKYELYLQVRYLVKRIYGLLNRAIKNNLLDLTELNKKILDDQLARIISRINPENIADIISQLKTLMNTVCEASNDSASVLNLESHWQKSLKKILNGKFREHKDSEDTAILSNQITLKELYSLYKDFKAKDQSFAEYVSDIITQLEENGKSKSSEDNNSHKILAEAKKKVIEEHLQSDIRQMSDEYEEARENTHAVDIKQQTFELEIEWVPKLDLIEWMRMADGAQCCVSSNKKNEREERKYSYWMALRLKGLTQGFVIRDKKTGKNIGFSFGRFGINKNNELCFHSEVQIYLKTGYRYKKVVNRISNEIQSMINLSLVKNPIKELTMPKSAGASASGIPAGYTESENKEIFCFQTVKCEMQNLYSDADLKGNDWTKKHMHVKQVEPSAKPASASLDSQSENTRLTNCQL